MKFEKLDVWKRSVRLSVDIYRHLSGCKDYGFRDQITRSGLSIPSNIAEGLERFSDREKTRFLEISKASCAELMTQVHIGREIGYIEASVGAVWIDESRQLAAMLGALIRRLQSKEAGLATSN